MISRALFAVSHRGAVFTMLVATLLWSMAAVVTRQLEATRGFEMTFWRSAVTLLVLAVVLGAQRGTAMLGQLRSGGRMLWLSGLMWCVMFTCFMMALALTTAANVLITMSLAPLMTAVLARFTLGHPVAQRTWVAIAVAGCGIVWMYAAGFDGNPRHLLGTAVALCVPLAGAINWNLSQRAAQHEAGSVDLVPAVLIGAALSTAITLPLSWPLQASAHDVAWLSLLGVFQLAVPCVMAVRAARVLPAPEMSLLSLLEIVFAIAWVWLATNEQPTAAVVLGGALVLLALLTNQVLALRAQQVPAGQPAR